MIIVMVRYNCKKGLRQRFLDAVNENGIGALSRAEQGNIKYEYSFAETEEDTLILTEIWENAHVLAAHSQSEHLKKMPALKAEFVESTELSKFEAEPLE